MASVTTRVTPRQARWPGILNLLQANGIITGLVDWDLAGPGRLIEDFAYMAWHFVPLHDEPTGDRTAGPPLADRPRRLRLLCDCYGLTRQERHTLVAEVAAMEVRQARPGSR